jgi:proton-dependent oligopeptide transporter, POT family
LSLGGILLVILGYGMYQPAAYAGVRQFTTAKTAAMGYAMLYALMNFGGWLNSFFAPIRKGIGIAGAYWIYAGLTGVSLIVTAIILTRKTVTNATAAARDAANTGSPGESGSSASAPPAVVRTGFVEWLKNHPLADVKFSFFIFSLIPVQTLFAHFWFTFAKYLERGFRGNWIGDNFEWVLNLNSALIFVFVPIVAAITARRKAYNMMVLGTFTMALPTFFLALGPGPVTIFSYVLLMTIGEAIWQPRFLGLATQIAPEGRAAAYSGVAQLPWFLTKVVTSFYAGWFLAKYCPAQGPLNTEFMWLVYALIAVATPVLLVLVRPWLSRGLKMTEG